MSLTMPELFEMCVALRDVHQTVKRTYGEKWPAVYDEFLQSLSLIAIASSRPFFESCIDVAKDAPSGFQTSTILAVAVEYKLRENARKSDGRS